MLLGDIWPPAYPLYELELKGGALCITSAAMGDGHPLGLEAVGLDEIEFCSLDKKKKELSFHASERGGMSFWYRKNENQVEEFYNERIRLSSKIRS